MGGITPKAYMGWWGSMGSPAQKYITTYTVSPYATKPLKGAAHNAVFNTFRRVKNQVLYVVIPAVIVWNVWAEARDYNEYLYTKAGREELEKANAA
jgi:ubiquinol-cytochrome c reductase subunit 8